MNIQENILELKEKFNKIKDMGYVESTRKMWTGVGKTFEDLIGKQEDQDALPDYKNIEIKTKLGYTKSNITLFNATPMSDDNFIADRLRKMYGYPDKDLKSENVLNCSMFVGKMNPIGKNFFFLPKLDINHNRLYLEVYDRTFNLLEHNKIYWDLNDLKNKIYQKMQYLALIKAWPKKINGIEYYKYYDIKFYELELDNFLKLLLDGKIIIDMRIGIIKSGDKVGSTHYRGTAFKISEDDLEKLYNRIS